MSASDGRQPVANGASAKGTDAGELPIGGRFEPGSSGTAPSPPIVATGVEPTPDGVVGVVGELSSLPHAVSDSNDPTVTTVRMRAAVRLLQITEIQYPGPGRSKHFSGDHVVPSGAVKSFRRSPSWERSERVCTQYGPIRIRRNTIGVSAIRSQREELT